jgi:hypothetical protein
MFRGTDSVSIFKWSPFNWTQQIELVSVSRTGLETMGIKTETETKQNQTINQNLKPKSQTRIKTKLYKISGLYGGDFEGCHLPGCDPVCLL